MKKSKRFSGQIVEIRAESASDSTSDTASDSAPASASIYIIPVNIIGWLFKSAD